MDPMKPVSLSFPITNFLHAHLFQVVVFVKDLVFNVFPVSDYLSLTPFDYSGFPLVYRKSASLQARRTDVGKRSNDDRVEANRQDSEPFSSHPRELFSSGMVAISKQKARTPKNRNSKKIPRHSYAEEIVGISAERKKKFLERKKTNNAKPIQIFRQEKRNEDKDHIREKIIKPKKRSQIPKFTRKSRGSKKGGSSRNQRKGATRFGIKVKENVQAQSKSGKNQIRAQRTQELKKKTDMMKKGKVLDQKFSETGDYDMS